MFSLLVLTLWIEFTFPFHSTRMWSNLEKIEFKETFSSENLPQKKQRRLVWLRDGYCRPKLPTNLKIIVCEFRWFVSGEDEELYFLFNAGSGSKHGLVIMDMPCENWTQLYHQPTKLASISNHEWNRLQKKERRKQFQFSERNLISDHQWKWKQ